MILWLSSFFLILYSYNCTSVATHSDTHTPHGVHVHMSEREPTVSCVRLLLLLGEPFSPIWTLWLTDYHTE